MRIHWESSLAIGVPKLDEDHKRLIGIFNYLSARREADVSSETISFVMEQLRKFASTHFPREEAYMQSIDYPDFEAHKKLHKHFREQTAALCIDVMNHKETAPQDIYQLLHTWIVEHILHEDKRIQAFQQAAALSCDTISL